MPKPDFIIVGAPKSGTTSLWGYLSQHPDVFMPEKKEPMYFCGYKPGFQGPLSEGYNRNMVVDKSEYLKLFFPAGPDQMVGEASTDYLSCPEAPARIHAWNPETKIIIMLRNPIERARSEHQHLLRDQHESLEFIDALMLENERLVQGFVPLFCHIRRGLYAEAVRKYLDMFGSNNVRIYLFDDLIADADKIYRNLLDFLELKYFEIDLGQKWNVSGIPKSRLIQGAYLLWNRAGKDARWKRIAQNLVPSREIRHRVRDALLRMNLEKGRKQTREENAYLIKKFESDIHDLERILDRDLGHWLSLPG